MEELREFLEGIQLERSELEVKMSMDKSKAMMMMKSS
jgi:hypothetical protein